MLLIFLQGDYFDSHWLLSINAQSNARSHCEEPFKKTDIRSRSWGLMEWRQWTRSQDWLLRSWERCSLSGFGLKLILVHCGEWERLHPSAATFSKGRQKQLRYIRPLCSQDGRLINAVFVRVWEGAAKQQEEIYYLTRVKNTRERVDHSKITWPLLSALKFPLWLCLSCLRQSGKLEQNESDQQWKEGEGEITSFQVTHALKLKEAICHRRPQLVLRPLQVPARLMDWFILLMNTLFHPQQVLRWFNKAVFISNVSPLYTSRLSACCSYCTWELYRPQISGFWLDFIIIWLIIWVESMQSFLSKLSVAPSYINQLQISAFTYSAQKCSNSHKGK